MTSCEPGNFFFFFFNRKCIYRSSPEELDLDITSFEFAALSTSYYIYPPPAGSFSILLHGARLSNRII